MTHNYYWVGNPSKIFDSLDDCLAYAKKFTSNPKIKII